MILQSERLILRPWREADRVPLAALSSDPQVMRFFAVIRDRAQSDAWMDRTQAHIDRHGFGVWAAEAPGVADLIGFVGLSTIPADTPVPAGVELVWTLAAAYWGRGYAPEAARLVAKYGFGRLHLPEILAFTAAVNAPSRRVMEKIGMRHDPVGSFDHPRVAPGVLRRHVLYRLARA
ncbi:GNAT family N-acetyltransferase [Rhodovastum atsumiense]|uniref:GNAT family N-acetyltransferase n=1 Tax=Rhodovastum atsumiense TaxID=504468 RepID=A0A5M6IUT6_9PROT|nr:GNAT family N-acetyltransferase [Rhodovastum atsumiense]KAA5612073.1 GNAT family N-acetyltransferase [Rhodovastum atsumiense]CAH2604055.1 GNAT family N-acetyltransferase [Rhodovastum atsumiense]